MPPPILPADRSLSGTTSLVTGAARGLGTAIVRHIAANGGDVAIHFRHSESEATILADEVRGWGQRAEVFQADLEHPDEAGALVRDVVNTFGNLDHVVYNVGPFLTTPFTDLSESDWDVVLNANLKSAWVAAVEAAPFLKRSGKGRIIHIGANSALIRTHSVYGLAKAALAHLSESLAIELAPGVTVNCIAPGMIEGAEPDARTRDLVIQRTPLRRLVSPEEIATMCVLVLSDAFAAVTGRTIVMDGGRWLR